LASAAGSSFFLIPIPAGRADFRDLRVVLTGDAAAGAREIPASMLDNAIYVSLPSEPVREIVEFSYTALGRDRFAIAFHGRRLWEVSAYP